VNVRPCEHLVMGRVGLGDQFPRPRGGGPKEADRALWVPRVRGGRHLAGCRSRRAALAILDRLAPGGGS
jgi:hypothetical protein